MERYWDEVMLKLLRQIEFLQEQLREAGSRIVTLNYEKKELEKQLKTNDKL